MTGRLKDRVAIAGQSILLGANSPNFGALYVMLDDFDKRAVRINARGNHTGVIKLLKIFIVEFKTVAVTFHDFTFAVGL